MQAIELEPHIQSDEKITLPEAYKDWFGKNARLILPESPEPAPEAASPYEIYEKLDLGEGGYARVSLAEAKQGIKEIFQRKTGP
jgi:hypothetical protein